MGDVRGKGLPAVRLASVVLGCFREAAFAEADLRGLVAALNHRVTGELVRRTSSPWSWSSSAPGAGCGWLTAAIHRRYW